MKMTKKLITSSFALILLLAHFSSALAAPQPFADVTEEDLNYISTTFLFEEGVFLGYPNGLLKGDTILNRAELMTIVVRMLNVEPDPEIYRDCFEDVTRQWFAPAVCYAKEQDWIVGYEGNVFKPSDGANQPEAIKMVLEPLFGEEIAAQTPEQIKETILNFGFNVESEYEESWYNTYVSFAISKNITGDLAWSFTDHNLGYDSDFKILRHRIAEFMMEAILTEREGWDYYDDYLRDELLLEQERDYLLSEAHPCYKDLSERTPVFLTDYIKENYAIEPVDDLSQFEQVSNLYLNEAEDPYFLFTGFCLLKNQDLLMFGNYFSQSQKTGEQLLVRLDKEGNLKEENVLECEDTIHSGHRIEQLPEASLHYIDPETYEMIDCIYAKDSKGVYVKGYLLIDDADPDTFEVVSFPYSKDAKNAYIEDLTIVNSDPDTFEVFEPTNPDLYPLPQYAKDKNYVYLEDFMIEGADPKTFEAIGMGEVPEHWKNNGEFELDMMRDFIFKANYAKDENNWYIGGRKIDDIDPQTFEVVNFFHAKDKDNAYVLRIRRNEYSSLEADLEVIEGADLNTFESLNSYYSKDKNAVYFMGISLEVDSTTAEVIQNKFEVHKAWLRDEEKIYYHHYEVTNIADIKTFEFINDQFAKDSQHVYDLGYTNYGDGDEVSFDSVENVDPDNFQPLKAMYIENPHQLYQHDGDIYYGNQALVTDDFVIEDARLVSDLKIVDDHGRVCELSIEAPYVAECEDLAPASRR